MDKLTDTERTVLDEIRRKPFSSQQTIADKLDIARTTVATHIERLHSKGYLLGRAYVLAETVDVCCVGGATMDQTMLLKDKPRAGTSNPASILHSPGGVARNVAENLARLSVQSRLASVVGNDDAGEAVLSATSNAGVDTTPMIQLPLSTGSYSAVIAPNGSLYVGVSDLQICEKLDRSFIDSQWQHITSSSMVFADTNLPAGTLAHLLGRCQSAGITTAVDAVSVAKAARLPAKLDVVDFLFCNLDEARAILGKDGIRSRAAARELVARGASAAIVSNGARGARVADTNGEHHIVPQPGDVVDESGAGDALIAGTMTGVLQGRTLADACRMGVAAATLTIQSTGRHAPDLSAARISRAAAAARRKAS